jgi:integrase family protein with SAM-like domain
MDELLAASRKRMSIHNGRTTGQRFVDVARPWLRYLGWWREPKPDFPFQSQLDGYVAWMRDERGFSPSTVVEWQRKIRAFLLRCSAGGRQLLDLRPADIDHYLATGGAQRWSRVSVRHNAGALRAFLRYAATQRACGSRLPATVRGPRIYAQESLPFAPAWSDVGRSGNEGEGPRHGRYLCSAKSLTAGQRDAFPHDVS